MNVGTWTGPLFLLPGVGLLVLSTSARYSRLHEELHHLDTYAEAYRAAAVDKLVVRARLFRDALVGLYLAAAMLATAPLLGGLANRVASKYATLIVGGLTAVAIVCVVFACLQLVRESVRSLHVICEHARQSNSQS